MRVHVISDMEGVAGIVKWEQTTGGESLYEEGRKLYTQEINAAVRGAKAAGATEIVVMDCHGAGKGWTFNSLVAEDLDPACEFVVQDEWTEYTEFLEQGCDAALFVGMHARAGTADGVMNHTISGRDFQNLWFNGTLVGETGINAALCGTWGCPVLLVTGRRRLVPRGQRAARRRPHDGRGEARLQLVQRAKPHAGSRARADRGGREARTRPICQPFRRTTRAGRARSGSSTRTRTPHTYFASGPASNASTTARSCPARRRGGRPGSSSTSSARLLIHVSAAMRTDIECTRRRAIRRSGRNADEPLSD